VVTGPSRRLEELRSSGVLAALGHPWEPRFVEHADGVRQAYVDEGEGPPVVLVHGNPTWSFYWRGLIAALSPRHRCIAPDHVGCGFSDAPADGVRRYTLEERVDDLEALLERAAVDGPVTLVVHDWGGAIGLGWAARRPERVGRLVVLNTAAFAKPAGKALPASLRVARDWSWGEAAVRGANLFVEVTVRACSVRPLPAGVRAAYRAPHDSWARRVSVARFVQDIPLEPGDPAWRELERVEAALPAWRDRPVHLFWGLRDWVFDADYLAEWSRRFPEAEVRAWPDAGHLVLEDAGSHVASRLVRVLD
jgi:haloalkane dehalogenase